MRLGSSSPWLALAVLALAGCGGEEQAPTPGQRERTLAKSPLPPAPAPRLVSPYEADGRTLIAAEEPVLGVAVPKVGRVVSRRPDVARVIVERIPFEAVERFYQARLLTGQVDRQRAGLRFADATPKPPGNPEARVEVFLQRTGRGTVIAIHDETPPRTPPPRGEAAVREAAGIAPVDFSKRVKGVTE